MTTPLYTIPKSRKQGFNLIEAAIVLAVVGTVIGGTWVVSSSVFENQRINRMVSAMQIIANKSQNIFTKTFVDSAAFSAELDVTSTAINSAVIPSDLIRNGSAIDPWGNQFAVTVAGGIYGTQLLVRLNNLKQSACIQLVTRISQGNRGSSANNTTGSSNLMYIDGTGMSTLSDFPILPTQTGCNNPQSGIAFHFSLNGN